MTGSIGGWGSECFVIAAPGLGTVARSAAGMVNQWRPIIKKRMRRDALRKSQLGRVLAGLFERANSFSELFLG
jgi:hypothetical protein